MKTFEELLKLKGTGSSVGDLRGIGGQSIEEIIANIPVHATSPRFAPEPDGSKVGLKFVWTDADGVTNRFRAHDIDPSTPAGSNAADEWIARWQKGKEYYDPVKGDFAHRNAHKPDSPFSDPAAANNTHIPIKTPADWLIEILKGAGKK